MPYVLMHMRGNPTTMQLPENTRYLLGTVEGVADELRVAAERAIAAGIEPWRLVLDPGADAAAPGSLGMVWEREHAWIKVDRCGGLNSHGCAQT